MEKAKKKVIFASKNRGKIKEIEEIMGGDNFKIIPLLELPEAPDIEETGSSFIENALLKAKGIYDVYKIPVLADDSGISVEQLNGEPGIYSARYSGSGDKGNNIKLINELKSFPEPHKAKFVCAAVYYDGIDIYSAIGEMHGRVIDEERGGNGFGYDPLFITDGYDVTNGELPDEVKNKISHRYKAFNKLKEEILRSQNEEK